MFILEVLFFIFNRKFIFNELILKSLEIALLFYLVEKFQIKGISCENIIWVNPGSYPAFFKFLTKKSFSLESKSNFDFLSFSLISVTEFFLILLVFINLKIIQKKIHNKSY